MKPYLRRRMFCKRLELQDRRDYIEAIDHDSNWERV